MLHGKIEDIEISRGDENSFDLWVNGKIRIKGESFSVVSQVEAHLLRGPKFDVSSEMGEVAEVIFKSL